jgi:hypothetical protein
VAPASAAARSHAGYRRVARRSGPAVRAKIAVQPIVGPNGSALRSQVVQILRGRGYRVVTSLAPVTGTAQYPGLAKENEITAFVVGDIEPRAHSHSVTFLVWTGSDGSVVGRWSVAAPPRQLCSAVSRGFWPRLGHSLARVKTPFAPKIAPARPMRIDAADDLDEPIVSDSFYRRRAPVRD